MQASSKKSLLPRREKVLYSILSWLVVNGKQPQVYQYFNFFLTEIQYIGILVWMQTSSLTYDNRNSGSIFMHKASKIIAFRDLFVGDSQTLFLSACSIAAWIYFAVMCLVLGFMFYTANKKRAINEKIQTCISSFFQFHSGFIFWIANMIFMTVLSSNWKGINFTALSSSDSQNQVIIVVQLLFMIFNYAIGVIGALFCFDPFCSGNLFAVRTSSFQSLNFLFKAILAPLAAFSEYETTYTRVIFIILAFGISCTRLIYIILEFPFYHYIPLKLARIFTITSMWVSVCNIFAIIWEEKGFTSSLSLIYLIILPFPVVLKLGLEQMDKSIERLIAVCPKSLKTKREVYGKLFAYKFLSENLNLSLNENKAMYRNELYFAGDLIDHSKSCEDSKCLCRFFVDDAADNSVKNTKTSLTRYFGSASSLFLMDAIPRIKNKADLKVTLADIIFASDPSRFSAALIYLFRASEDDADYFLKVKSHILIKKIQGKLINYYNESKADKLNIVKFVDYQSDTANFQSRIASATADYINFWDHVRKPNFKVTDILRKSENIEKAADNIDKLWATYIEKYESFYHIMKDPYRIYLSLVRNTPSTSSSIVKKLKWKKKLRGLSVGSNQITEDDLASTKVLSFYISMLKETIGRINYASENVQISLGYNAQDLIGRNISFIMPPIFAEKHDQILLKHLEKSKKDSEMKDYYTDIVYVKTKEGPILPCSIYMTVFPYLQRELLYTGILKVLSTKSDFIITDSRGYIDSFTEDIGKKLNLNFGKKLHIREVCLDVDKLYGGQSNKMSIYNMNPEASEMNLDITNQKKFLSNMTDDQKEDLIPRTAILSFIKRDSPSKYYKYNSILNKKVIVNKSVFIFQLELTYESKQETKILKETIPKEEEQTENATNADDDNDDDFEDNIPIERPLSPAADPTSTMRLASMKRPLLNEIVGDVPSDSKDDFTDTTHPSKHILKKLYPKINGPEFSDNNLEKKTSSHYGTTTMTQTKIGTMLRFINSAGEVEDETQKKKRLSVQSPLRAKRFAFMQSERGSTASVTTNINSKLETAIYSIPADKSVNFLRIIMWILVLISIMLLALFYAETDKKLVFVKENISVITTANLRMFQITELNRRTRIVSLYNYKYVTDARFSIFRVKVPILYLAVTFINSITVDLNRYNNQVRTAVEKIDPSLQNQLFGNVIPVTDPEIKGVWHYDTIFGAIATVSTKAKLLAKTANPLSINKDNYYVNFVLNNTLNDQLVVSETIKDALLRDNELKLQFLTNLTLYFIGIIVAIGALIFALFGFNQFKALQSRNRFLELFLRLTDEELDANLTQVRVFKNMISKKGVNFEEEDDHQRDLPMSPKSKNSKLKASAKGYRIRKREANSQGINYKVFTAGVLVIALVVGLLLPFLYINTMINVSNEAIKKDTNIIVQVNTFLYDMNLVSVAVYEYIQWNGTTLVRNRPIGEEIENTSSRLSSSMQVFADILDQNLENDKVINSTLEMLLTGNLCTSLNISKTTCQSSGGILEKGNVGMNTYLLLTLRRVKDIFDTSDRTPAKGVIALNQTDLIILEYLYTTMQLPAYQKLGDILQSNVENQIKEMGETLKIALIVSIVVIIVLGYVISKVLCELVEKEKIKWRKLMRKIPFNIALTNKAFKNYLIKESHHLLDSLKNMQ